jgi:proteasome lid subunit RPN8/RPN11
VRVAIEAGALEVLQRDAEARYPLECCGAVLGSVADRRILRAVPLPNAAVNPKAGFRIDPGDLVTVQEIADASGLEFVGVYHSHPDGPAVCSREDLANAPPWQWIVIVEVRGGKAGQVRVFASSAG